MAILVQLLDVKRCEGKRSCKPGQDAREDKEHNGIRVHLLLAVAQLRRPSA
jgi:hypothetical protein